MSRRIKGGLTPRYAEHSDNMTYIRDVARMVATVRWCLFSSEIFAFLPDQVRFVAMRAFSLPFSPFAFWCAAGETAEAARAEWRSNIERTIIARGTSREARNAKH